ncbi:MAG TPA: hypothetical protein VGO08_11275 [Burkholderiales bacterium]|jgi:hypothetical protein|nr:hypothetical protein [Burkholderiales bacterium]
MADNRTGPAGTIGIDVAASRKKPLKSRVTPEETLAIVRRDLETWADVMQRTGIRPE